jgi:hypothetical protein
MEFINLKRLTFDEIKEKLIFLNFGNLGGAKDQKEADAETDVSRKSNDTLIFSLQQLLR